MSSLVFAILLILIGVAGFATAIILQLRETARRDSMEKALGGSAAADVRKLIRRSLGREKPGTLKSLLIQAAPAGWSDDPATQTRLVQAGFDGEADARVYSAIRAVTLFALCVVAVRLTYHMGLAKTVVGLLLGASVGLMLPTFVLLRLVDTRQERIKRALPDAVDLLVVCVEAGISLDGAILRVARDLVYVHPDLAAELLFVSRITNAGITREEALRGMYDRTGVEELRSLAGTLVQSEKWGSSSARVLRVAAETLRRKRKQGAEKNAATAPLKMIVPMALFIFPALFVVILGPAVLRVIAAFRGR